MVQGTTHVGYVSTYVSSVRLSSILEFSLNTFYGLRCGGVPVVIYFCIPFGTVFVPVLSVYLLDLP